MSVTVTCVSSAEDLPENGADPAHLAAIHEKIFSDGNDLEERRRWRWIRHSWTACWQPDPELQHQASVHMQMTFVLLGKLHFYHNDISVRQVGSFRRASAFRPPDWADETEVPAFREVAKRPPAVRLPSGALSTPN